MRSQQTSFAQQIIAEFLWCLSYTIGCSPDVDCYPEIIVCETVPWFRPCV